jgi:hypothetical protein
MLFAFAVAVAEQGVTYVRVEKPKLDIVAVVLGSFKITVILAVTALVIGIALGLTLIRRRRREPFRPVGLSLDERPES